MLVWACCAGLLVPQPTPAAGYRVEQVAAEPHVIDPVDMAFDEAGRIWVVEMSDYPYDERDGRAPGGRVRVLDDLDGDGVMDRGRVLAEGLGWPTSLALWQGGAFVVAAPDVLYLKDTDGDGRADVSEVVLTGLGRRNVQALANNLRWSPDGWLVASSGGNGGTLRSVRDPRAPPVALRGMDFRFRPSGVVEAVTGGGQFGHSLDDFGRRFVCNNSDHARHVVVEQRELARQPLLTAPALVCSIAVEGGSSPVFRTSPPEAWRVERTRLRVAGIVKGPIEHGGKATGYFTSATGITVYRGTALPGCDGDLFIGDVASNLVHHKRLTPRGVTFRAARVEQEHEFLVSSDIWFRPVNFANGPDGALYVCDMRRAVVEHPWSLPEQVMADLDLSKGDRQGRLWRVVGVAAAAYRQPALGSATTAELVEALRRPDGWWRDTAARLLRERRDRAAIALLVGVLVDGIPPARVLALWLLDELGGLRTDDLVRALADPSAGVRENAVQLARLRSDAKLRAAVLACSGDPSARVRMMVAHALADVPGEAATAALADILVRSGDDGYIRAAVFGATGLPGRLAALTRALAARPEVPADALGAALEMWAASPAAAEREAAISEVARLAGARPGLLGRLAAGLRRARTSLRAWLAENAESPIASAMRGVFEVAVTVAGDPEAALAERVAAIDQLAHAPFAVVRRVLVEQLAVQAAAELQEAAARALGGFDEPGLTALLFGEWPSRTPVARRAILQAAMANVARWPALLDLVAEGVVGVSDLDAAQREQLVGDRRSSVAARASQLLVEPRADRAAVIARYQRAVRDGGDAARGREVYRRSCAQCHWLAGEGIRVGPDLETVRETAPDALVARILDPSREVDPRYALYVVELRDGRSLAGMIRAESATSLILVDAAGAEKTLLRSEVAGVRATGVSLMTPGLENTISPAAMADLVRYLVR